MNNLIAYLSNNPELQYDLIMSIVTISAAAMAYYSLAIVMRRRLDKFDSKENN
jgi:hypothetical protein